MEQAGRDPSRDPQHDRTLDAMMSNTHTRAARESEESKPSELGGEEAVKAFQVPSGTAWTQRAVSTGEVLCYLDSRLLRC